MGEDVVVVDTAGSRKKAPWEIAQEALLATQQALAPPVISDTPDTQAAAKSRLQARDRYNALMIDSLISTTVNFLPPIPFQHAEPESIVSSNLKLNAILASNEATPLVLGAGLSKTLGSAKKTHQLFFAAPKANDTGILHWSTLYNPNLGLLAPSGHTFSFKTARSQRDQALPKLVSGFKASPLFSFLTLLGKLLRPLTEPVLIMCYRGNLRDEDSDEVIGYFKEAIDNVATPPPPEPHAPEPESIVPEKPLPTDEDQAAAGDKGENRKHQPKNPKTAKSAIKRL